MSNDKTPKSDAGGVIPFPGARVSEPKDNEAVRLKLEELVVQGAKLKSHLDDLEGQIRDVLIQCSEGDDIVPKMLRALEQIEQARTLTQGLIDKTLSGTP